MTGLLRQRLHNQRLTSTSFRTAAEVVAWFGAVQAQDYPGARWALGLRAPRLTLAGIDAAFARGEILRTHILRPTWHLVTPADIRWMQTLTAPRVKRTMAGYADKVGLDKRTFGRARDAMQRALDGRELTRDEISDVLAGRGIKATGVPLAHLLMDAELEQVITSGGLRGNKYTYALLDQRAPKSPPIDTDEALARLTRRFFASHGPATLRDMSWWSGLPQRDVARGLDMLGRDAQRVEHAGCTYWSLRDRATSKPGRGVWLLPNYDEFLIAYQDRELSAPAFALRPRDIFAHYLVVDGVLAGVWRRSATGFGSTATPSPYRRLGTGDRAGLATASAAFARFHAAEG